MLLSQMLRSTRPSRAVNPARNSTTSAGLALPRRKQAATFSGSRMASARFTRSSATSSLGDANLEAILAFISGFARVTADFSRAWERSHDITNPPITSTVMRERINDHVTITLRRAACMAE